MKILLFEWMMSGGLLVEDLPPDDQCEFQRQGRSMLQSLARDLCDVPGIECLIPADPRLNLRLPAQERVQTFAVTTAAELKSKLLSLAESADGIILIAPECEVRMPDGEVSPCLLGCVNWMRPMHEKLLSPDASFIEIASDKTTTCDRLEQQGVPVVRGMRLDHFLNSSSPVALKHPLVLKPNRGAGSDGIEIIPQVEAIPEFEQPGLWRVEELAPGRAVSCGVLCGPGGNEPLLPGYQIFDAQPIGSFQRLDFIKETDIAARTTSLAVRAVEAIGAARGYVGVDMILGSSPEEDRVIEINPRLTTGYSQLRSVLEFNPAARMLETASLRKL